MCKSKPHIFVILEKILQYLPELWSTSILCLTACCGERAQFFVEASLQSLLCAWWLWEIMRQCLWVYAVFRGVLSMVSPSYTACDRTLRLDFQNTLTLCAHECSCMCLLFTSRWGHFQTSLFSPLRWPSQSAIFCIIRRLLSPGLCWGDHLCTPCFGSDGRQRWFWLSIELFPWSLLSALGTGVAPGLPAMQTVATNIC